MYPQILQSIVEMAQMRIDVCARLPANHPFQPYFIQPIQSIPADAENLGEPAVPESVNHEFSNSHPKPTTQTSDPSFLDELVNHCSGELPGFEQNLERASEIASDEAISESPQQQQPEQRPNSPNLSHLPDQSLIDADTLEEQTFVVHPLSVALPSEATHELE
jgi:hypothetical protein